MADFAPIDYTSSFANLPNPTQSFMQGVQGAVGVQQLELQQQQQQYQMQRMRMMQQASYQVAQNPTPQAIAQLSLAFPEMSEQYKRSYDMLTPAQQQQRLNTATQVYAAAQNGRPDLASQLLHDRADALENSGGDPQEIHSTRTMADWAQQHPDSFKMSAGLMLSGIMGPDKFGQTYKDLGGEQREQALAPAKQQQAAAEALTKTAEATAAPQKIGAEIADIRSQIAQRAGQLNLGQDELTSKTLLKLRELGLQYGTPPDDTRKLINESAMNGAAGEQSAARLNDLADRMGQLSASTGFVGNAAEAAKRILGVQDGVSALKQEYTRIVNNQALAGMKDSLGGRVTDVDMKTAMGSVPSPNASPEVVTSYLRGVAKLQMLEAARQQAQAEWLSQVGHAGHLGPTKQDITVMGTQVPAGSTFADWSRQFVQKRAEQISAQSQLSKVQNLPFMQKWGGAAPTGQPQQPQSGQLGSGTFGAQQ